jgi:hypothetical protein
MESKIQKSVQSNRKGEVAEGLPGSLKSVACVKETPENLGDPTRSSQPRGKCSRPKGQAN